MILIVLSTGRDCWMVGRDDFLPLFRDTITANLEGYREGSRYPLVQGFLRSEKLGWEQAEKGLEELKEIREAFQKFPVSRVGWNLVNSEYALDLEPWFPQNADNLEAFFTTIDKQSIFSALGGMMESARRLKKDMSIEARDTDTMIWLSSLEEAWNYADDPTAYQKRDNPFDVIYLSTQDRGYVIGSAQTFRTFCNTVVCKLEHYYAGKRFPRIIEDLLEGKIRAEHVKQALREIKTVRREFHKMRIDELAWKQTDPMEPLSAAIRINEKAKHLDEFILTCRGKNLLDVMEQCMRDARKRNADVDRCRAWLGAAVFEHVDGETIDW